MADQVASWRSMSADEVLKVTSEAGIHARLMLLRMISGALGTYPPPAPEVAETKPGESVNVSVNTRQFHHIDGSAVVIRTEFRTIIDLGRTFKMLAVFEAKYDFMDSETSERDRIVTSRITAIMNAWPYLREYIQSSLGRLGGPSIPLPILTAGAVPAMLGYRDDGTPISANEEKPSDAL